MGGTSSGLSISTIPYNLSSSKRVSSSFLALASKSSPSPASPPDLSSDSLLESVLVGGFSLQARLPLSNRGFFSFFLCSLLKVMLMG